MKQMLIQSAVLICLSAVAAWVGYALHPRAPSLYAVAPEIAADEVTVQQVMERWRDRVIWLDARPREQYLMDHIPGARLLNEQEFEAQLLDLLEELERADRPVIIYCSGQKCDASRDVRERLIASVPLDDCYILHGGWPAWKASHQP
jgi:rhodanese-related sulfurtransferase